jgi:hypothetical protein
LFASRKPLELTALVSQLGSAFEFLGPPVSWEALDIRRVGNDFVQVKVFSKQKDQRPLFWDFVFHRRNDRWEPISFSFQGEPFKSGFFQ